MTLDPGRVQALFLAALGQETPADRSKVLDRECGADHELRSRVEALLIAHDKPARVLDLPLVAPGDQARTIALEFIDEVDPLTINPEPLP